MANHAPLSAQTADITENLAERVDLERRMITSFNILKFVFKLGVKGKFYTQFYTCCFFERQKMTKSGDGLGVAPSL